jgi:hypothetical protein
MRSWTTSIGRNCTAETASNAAWPQATSGSTAAGTCVAGWTGAPLRACGLDGVWSSTVTNPCTVLSCAAATLGGAVFPTTTAGQNGVGTCINGYTQDPGGAPIASCSLAGAWTGTVTRPCLRTYL